MKRIIVCLMVILTMSMASTAFAAPKKTAKAKKAKTTQVATDPYTQCRKEVKAMMNTAIAKVQELSTVEDCDNMLAWVESENQRLTEKYGDIYTKMANDKNDTELINLLKDYTAKLTGRIGELYGRQQMQNWP